MTFSASRNAKLKRVAAKIDSGVMVVGWYPLMNTTQPCRLAEADAPSISKCLQRVPSRLRCDCA